MRPEKPGKLLRWWKWGGDLSGTWLLTRSSVAAQGLGLVATPILTRLYTPEQYGQLGLLLAFVSVSAVVICLRYDSAIIGTHHAHDSRSLSWLSLAIAFTTAPVWGVLLWGVGSLGWMGYQDLPKTMPLWASLLVGLIAVNVVLRNNLIRAGNFSQIAQANLSQSLVGLGLRIGCGLAGWGLWGLLLAELGSRLWCLPTLFRSAHLGERPRVGHLLETARQFENYPRLNGFSSLLDSLTQNTVVPALNALYGAKEAGYFVLVQRVIFGPLGILYQNFADVFQAQFAGRLRESAEQATTYFVQQARRLRLLAVVIGLTLLAAPWGFVWAFGNTWQTAGWATAIMATWIAAAFWVSPLSRIVLVLPSGPYHKQRYDWAASVALAIAVGTAYLTSLPLLWGIALIALGQTLAYGYYYWLIQAALRSRNP